MIGPSCPSGDVSRLFRLIRKPAPLETVSGAAIPDIATSGPIKLWDDLSLSVHSSAGWNGMTQKEIV